MKSNWVSTRSVILTMIWLILLVSACAQAPATPASTPASGSPAEASPPPQTTQESDAAAGFSTAVAARTPVPTPTPSNIERAVDSFADRTGLGQRIFLGLSAREWTELVGTALIIVGGYLVARLLVNQVLRRIVGRTKTKLDDEIFAEIKDELKWLMVVYITSFAISDLSFLSDSARTAVGDLLFILNLLILTSLVLSLIGFAGSHYRTSLKTAEDQKRLDPVILSIQRFAYFIVLVVALSIGLSHFGANANTLYITLIITGLIISLAARDIISDLLSGFIILIDQPFREGDSVHIRDLDTWGDVLGIGTRTTRIRTKDNRELIVPNSQVAKSQIVNYNYPDPKFRLDTYIGVAYGIDIDRVRKTATEAVRSVDCVLEDEPVDVLFTEFNNASRKVRVRWWVATFHDQWHAIDAVNVALESAFEKAQIDMPYETYDLRVHMDERGNTSDRPEPIAAEEDSE